MELSIENYVLILI